MTLRAIVRVRLRETAGVEMKARTVLLVSSLGLALLGISMAPAARADLVYANPNYAVFWVPDIQSGGCGHRTRPVRSSAWRCGRDGCGWAPGWGPSWGPEWRWRP